MKSSLVRFMLFVGLIFSVDLSARTMEFERLFTTAEQRAVIDKDHLAFKRQVLSGQTNAKSIKQADRRLFFEALLRTEVGYSVWLNGAMVEGEKAYHDISFNTRSIKSGKLVLKTPKGIRKLRIGQVYWVDQDKITESYEQP